MEMQSHLTLDSVLNKSALFILKFCVERFIDTVFDVQLMNCDGIFIDYFLSISLHEGHQSSGFEPEP
jgi:hypothetical protein